MPVCDLCSREAEVAHRLRPTDPTRHHELHSCRTCLPRFFVRVVGSASYSYAKFVQASFNAALFMHAESDDMFAPRLTPHHEPDRDEVTFNAQSPRTAQPIWKWRASRR